jgi:hypothetical protein
MSKAPPTFRRVGGEISHPVKVSHKLSEASEPSVVLCVDSREPWPHPWEQFLPEGWIFKRGILETGDLALAALPEAGVIERKTRVFAGPP